MRLENPKRIDLVFENCEVEKIPLENISTLNIELDSSSYFYGSLSNVFLKNIASKYVSIGFKNLTDEQKKFINRKDLTHIDLIFENSNIYIQVPSPLFFMSWLPNPYQKVEKIKDEIYIVIFKHISLNLIRLKILDWYYFLNESLFYRTRDFVIHPLVERIKDFLRIK